MVEKGGGKYVVIPLAFVENGMRHLKRRRSKDSLGLWERRGGREEAAKVRKNF